MGLAAVIPADSAEEMGAEKEASAPRIYEADRLLIRPHHLMCMTCFHGGREELAPIAADNPLRRSMSSTSDQRSRSPWCGCCMMICPPCSLYDPGTGPLPRRHGDEPARPEEGPDVLQKLGLEYGDTPGAGAPGAPLRADPDPPATSAATGTARSAPGSGGSAASLRPRGICQRTRGEAWALLRLP